ncbi:MAG: sporulation integral membrane protein YtvI [Bacillota bacterium]
MDRPLKLIIYFILGLFLFVLAVLFIKYSFIYLSPFIIASVLASLIDPIINKLEDKIALPRGIIVLIVLILIVALVVIFIIVGVSQISVELNKLLQNLPDYKTLGKQFNWIVQQNNQLQEIIDNLDISSSMEAVIQSNLQMLYSSIRNEIIKLVNELFSMLSKLPLLFIILFLSFIATFFITKDKDQINNFIVKLFPGKWRPVIYELRDELAHSAVGLLRAQLTLISISGVIAGIGLKILGNPYAFSLGILAAILDLIPIIGPALIFYPWILYNLLSGNASHAFSLLIIHVILAAIRSGAEGKVVGANLGLHPLSTMIALYVGYRVMGTIGFLVGPTILIIIKALFSADLITLKD